MSMLSRLATTGGAVEKTYIEDVFSTYLYTGNASTQTINNGIDLAGKGGMVWLKGRSGATNHALYDTSRGATKDLVSNSTAVETTQSTGITAFNANGFSIGPLATLNTSAATYASWTFRKAPKFFDVVTYTGNSANRTIAHSLGSVPGMIIVKRTDSTGAWYVYHRSNTATKYMMLDDTSSVLTASFLWNSTEPTNSVFSIGPLAVVNASGATYVAYLFAHDTTTDGLIQCGSYSGTNQVNLGWEPQYVMIKATGSASWGDWYIMDNMRGLSAKESADLTLEANLANAEGYQSGWLTINATGFKPTYAESGQTYIYMAIRRGPMRAPTDGTKVFSVGTATGNGTSNTFTTNFPVDLSIDKGRTSSQSNWWIDRLRGGKAYVRSDGTNAELIYATDLIGFDSNTTLVNKNYGSVNGQTYVNWMFKRAPGFFDVVCYTGTGANRTVNHNLWVAPELVIIKNRSDGTSGYADTNWFVSVPNFLSSGYCLFLNSNAAKYNWTGSYWSTFGVSSSSFSITDGEQLNRSGNNYVAYLFASCSGVSKVGSYTGNGSSQTINCGFTNGARFVMIKRTDATGDWYVWDSARGIVASNDPHLSLNTTAAEVTTDDTIDPYYVGCIVNQVAATNMNVNGATYIYLAIA